MTMVIDARKTEVLERRGTQRIEDADALCQTSSPADGFETSGFGAGLCSDSMIRRSPQNHARFR